MRSLTKEIQNRFFLPDRGSNEAILSLFFVDQLHRQFADKIKRKVRIYIRQLNGAQ